MVTLGYGDARVTVAATREGVFERPARSDLQRQAWGFAGPAEPVRVAPRSADALRTAREETGFAFEQAAVRGQRRADQALPRDGGAPEGSVRGHLVEIAGSGSERIRRRCSPINDPAFRIDPALRLAGQRFERLAAQAEGVERMRGTLDDTPPSTDADPDAARARAVRAFHAFERIAGQIPALPALVTPNGNVSEWQVLQLVVLQRQTLVRVACGDKGWRYRKAKALLEAALERVEGLLPEWAK
jgi:hypothetical protein